MTARICENCKFWNKPIDESGWDGFPVYLEMHPCSISYGNYVPGRPSFFADSTSGIFGCMITSADFGCILWESHE